MILPAAADSARVHSPTRWRQRSAQCSRGQASRRLYENPHLHLPTVVSFKERGRLATTTRHHRCLPIRVTTATMTSPQALPNVLPTQATATMMSLWEQRWVVGVAVTSLTGTTSVLMLYPRVLVRVSTPSSRRRASLKLHLHLHLRRALPPPPTQTRLTTSRRGGVGVGEANLTTTWTRCIATATAMVMVAVNATATPMPKQTLTTQTQSQMLRIVFRCLPQLEA